MGRENCRIVLNSLIAVAVLIAWIVMMTRGGGMLSSAGLRSLRYFTVLSNLLEAIASVILVAVLLRRDLFGDVLNGRALYKG